MVSDCGGADQFRCKVSVINLVATPERYHDKNIVVEGYIEIGSGLLRLAVTKGDFDYSSMVLIDISEEEKASMHLSNSGFFHISGKFQSCGNKPKEPMTCYNSIIPDIGKNGEPIIVSRVRN